MAAKKLNEVDVRQLALEGKSYSDAAMILRVNKSSVRRFAINNGIKFKNKRITHFNNETTVNSVVELYESGLTGDKIAENLCISRSTVYSILSDNNVKLESKNYKSRGYLRLNYSAFGDFESDHLAPYFYGWLLSDGCISDSGNLTIELQYGDKFIIDSLYNYVGLNREASVTTSKLRDKTFKTASFSLSDATITTRLMLQGLTPRKSKQEVVPLFYEHTKPSASYFWRGCLEGDGNIHLSKSSNSSTISLVGSKSLLESFIEFSEIVCGVSKKATPIPVKSSIGLYNVSYCNNDALLPCSKIWDGSGISLPRKYEQSLKLISRETARQDRYLSKFIYWNRNKFEARVRHKGKPIHLGMFTSFEDACTIRDEFISLLNTYKEE